jgi:arylsulfatase A-like enzyme
LLNSVSAAPSPFLGYYHFLPPHFPYKTRQDFFGVFEFDKFQPVEKSDSIFMTDRTVGKVDEFRQWYDEYVLYVDTEFARLYDYLDKNGLLENTWLVLTSDHGEMFERGIVGHQTPAFYQPLLHIPLLIFPPQQKDRIDIYENTSAIDVLPTLAYLNKQEKPEWSEGIVLPPYRTADTYQERDVYAIRAKKTGKNDPILQASAMLTRGKYKLTYIYGYEKPAGVDDIVELYDLNQDPEEINDISTLEKDITESLLADLVYQIEKSG